MTQPFIQPYLFFGGRCEEAIEFYKRTINAKLDMLMYHRESPDAPPPGMLQPGFEDKVMHATLRIGDSVVMASDGCDDKSKFDGFRLSLFLPTEADASRVFDALAENGQVMMPLTKTFWSPCFGMLTDQFGVGWMVTVASQTEPLEQAAAKQAQALGLAPPTFRDGPALTLGGLNAKPRKGGRENRVVFPARLSWHGEVLSRGRQPRIPEQTGHAGRRLLSEPPGRVRSVAMSDD
jgi:PhnB protein